MRLTWEEVRKRSEQLTGIGLVWCWDCYLNYHSVAMPCLRHCKDDEERKERDDRFSRAMMLHQRFDA